MIAILIIAMLAYTIYIAIDEAKNSMEIIEALMNFGEENDMARETIEEFITNRDFWKSDTAEDLRSLYQFMVDLGAKHDDAIDMIECTIGAIANEYGD